MSKRFSSQARTRNTKKHMVYKGWLKQMSFIYGTKICVPICNLGMMKYNVYHNIDNYLSVCTK